ncbi:hypothetical protein [Umezawaea beigongshangensis]|uniref:hypothetical protein n=1 Tax=Umezawaea beigongshangensis TaxID=2780383 RepID=UPI0018F24EAD|nr:hypothetical protein [Umezawaea beigongshangensis]
MSELDARAADVAAAARHMLAQFPEGRHGRLHTHGAVHGIRPQAWIAGIVVPAPTCHVGSGSWDFTRLVPTTDPVTCGRCLHSAEHRTTPLPEADQLSLLDLR